MALRDSISTSTLTKRSTATWLETRRSRRIKKTEDFVQDFVVPMFESVTNFLEALTEGNNEELQHYLEQHKNGILKDIKKRFREASNRLLYKGALSRKQWTILRNELAYDSVTFLPCYHTISRFWKKQDFIADDITDERFFELLDNGVRILVSPQHRISIRSRLRWILYVVCHYFGHNVAEFRESCAHAISPRVHVFFDVLLWDDGGKMWGSRNGLFSALKGTEISVMCGGHEVPMAEVWRKFYIDRSWTLSAQRKRENSETVAMLHGDEIAQWNDIRTSGPISYGSYSLYPEVHGFTADHGARSKSVKQDTPTTRCGECTAVFDSHLNNAGRYAFLDWRTLLTTPEVTPENWDQVRFQEIPEHLKQIPFSLLSYDNFHNYVGHVKNLFVVLTCDLSRPCVDEVEEQFSAYVCIPVVAGAKTRIWDFISGYQWRLASLHFYSIFEETFSGEEVRESFNVLFDLLTEIHLLNYVYIKKRDPDFVMLQIRYATALYMYTAQLIELFPSSSLAALDRVFLHKILSHSVRLFRKFCPAASSCETGEGKISCVNRWLRVCSCRPDQYQRKILLHLVLEEEEKAMAIQKAELEQDQAALSSLSGSRSPVFKDDFFAKYQPRKFKLRVPYDADRMDTLVGDSARIIETEYIQFLSLALDKPADWLIGRQFVSIHAVEEEHMVLLVDTTDAMQRVMGCESTGAEPFRVRYASPGRRPDIQRSRPPDENLNQVAKLEKQIRVANDKLASIEQHLPSEWRRLVLLAEHYPTLHHLYNTARDKLARTLDDTTLYYEKLVRLVDPVEEPQRPDYPGMTVSQLKHELKLRSLPITGRKEDLLERLTASLEEAAVECDPSDSESSDDDILEELEQEQEWELLSEDEDESVLDEGPSSFDTQAEDDETLASVLGLQPPHPEFRNVFHCYPKNRKHVRAAKRKAKELWDETVTKNQYIWVDQELWSLAQLVYDFLRRLKPDFFALKERDLDELQHSIQKLYIEYKNLMYTFQKAATQVANTLYNKARHSMNLERLSSKLRELTKPPEKASRHARRKKSTTN